MFKKLSIFILLSSLALFADSFTQSKKILKDIYKDNQTTFYCGCQYNYENQGNMIQRDTCGYEPRNTKTKKGNINERARRIEWEHVMPAQNFGKHLPCWKEGGRKACQKDSIFQKMEADMMNLVPATC
jgi:deoxyribonuclease-1